MPRNATGHRRGLYCVFAKLVKQNNIILSEDLADSMFYGLNSFLLHLVFHTLCCTSCTLACRMNPVEKASQLSPSFDDTCHVVTFFPQLLGLPTSLVVPSPASPAIHDVKKYHTSQLSKKNKRDTLPITLYIGALVVGSFLLAFVACLP